MSRIGAVVVESPIRRGLALVLVLLSVTLSGCGAVDWIKDAVFPRNPR
jgi:hypothetical protein